MPNFKFTARSLPPVPATGQVDYWDEGLANFGMRVSSGGRRSWVAMYRYNGTKRRLKLGTHPEVALADARDKAKEALDRADKGGDPATQRKVLRARSDTFEDIASRYVDEYAKVKKRSWYKDDQILKAEVIPVIGRKRVGDVRRRDVHDVLRPIIERGSLIRANHTLEVVRKLFNWYSGTLDEPIPNPAARMEKPGRVEHRRRFLKADELKQFWAALTPVALGEDGVAAFKLLALTAQREMEVMRMRWQDVDLDEGTWVVPGDHAKNTLDHLIPLTPLAISILRRLKKRAKANAVYVFGSPVKEGKHVTRVFIEKRIVKIREAGQLVDVTPHDLRRTVTTYFGKLKVPQLIKKKILNHEKKRKDDVTDIYDRFEYLDEKRDALEKWEVLLLAMVKQPDGSGNVVELARAVG
jgi:integrase